ncbi:MAG: Ornithine lipid N-methyltransferase [Candidatus Celerinatantimonas neptuna]|nr:MAG: Ornithine lipid N-methyltransferase [Candidatus Celerinatantimonas neptuna]
MRYSSIFKLILTPMNFIFSSDFIQSNGLFLKQFVTKPRSVGAILPSSKFLAKKMMDQIDFSKARCIVEIGPGTGAFTEQLLKYRKSDQCQLILIETNELFCRQLQDKYQYVENLRIIHDSGEKVNFYKMKYEIDQIDYVVSGIPFSSLPKQVSQNILTSVTKAIGSTGSLILFQYSLFKMKTITMFFDITHIERSWLNVPPALVFSCRQKAE